MILLTNQSTSLDYLYLQFTKTSSNFWITATILFSIVTEADETLQYYHSPLVLSLYDPRHNYLYGTFHHQPSNNLR
jgi:hypothetical protein